MRCKKHPYDVSSAVGVCASCLRERILSLMAAQADADAQVQVQVQFSIRDHSRLASRKLDPQLPPPHLSLARSVHGRRQRFYSTPLVGATGGVEVPKETSKKQSSNGWRLSSMFFGLFRSKSRDPELDSDPNPGLGRGDSCTASPLWFSTIIPGRRKKQSRTFSLDESTIGGERKVRRDRDRGMSPAGCSDDEDDGHFRGGSSGYSSESSQGWRQTPRGTPTTVRKTTSHSRNVSGFVFCLSPLVRASPNRHWNLPEMAVGIGESRPPTQAHFHGRASFNKNRSRKLADIGRQRYDNRRR